MLERMVDLILISFRGFTFIDNFTARIRSSKRIETTAMSAHDCYAFYLKCQVLLLYFLLKFEFDYYGGIFLPSLVR